MKKLTTKLALFALATTLFFSCKKAENTLDNNQTEVIQNSLSNLSDKNGLLNPQENSLPISLEMAREMAIGFAKNRFNDKKILREIAKEEAVTENNKTYFYTFNY